METMKKSDSRFAKLTASGLCLLLISLGAGLLTRILVLPAHVAETVRSAGLAGVLVGLLVAGFGLLVRQQANCSMLERFAPVLCLAYGLLFGNAFFGRSFPFSAIGLAVGLTLWWSASRRRGMA